MWFLQQNLKVLFVYMFYAIFVIFDIYLFLCPSDGTLNGAPCQGQQPLGTQKTVSLDFVEE